MGEPIVRQYLKRFPDYLKTKRRKKYLAKDPLDNLLNLGYEVLKHEILLVTILGILILSSDYARAWVLLKWYKMALIQAPSSGSFY